MLNDINYSENQTLSTPHSGPGSCHWVMAKQSAQWRSSEVHPRSTLANSEKSVLKH